MNAWRLQFGEPCFVFEDEAPEPVACFWTLEDGPDGTPDVIIEIGLLSVYVSRVPTRGAICLRPRWG